MFNGSLRISTAKCAPSLRIPPQDSIGEDASAQSPAALERVLGARPDGAIHPVARRTMLRSEKPDVLNAELLSDQPIEILLPLDNYIAPKNGWRHGFSPGFGENGLVHFPRKKGDLPLIIRLEVEKTVSFHSPPGDAVHLLDFDRFVAGGSAPVVTEEIVAGLVLNMPNAIFGNIHGGTII